MAGFWSSLPRLQRCHSQDYVGLADAAAGPTVRTSVSPMGKASASCAKPLVRTRPFAAVERAQPSTTAAPPPALCPQPTASGTLEEAQRTWYLAGHGASGQKWKSRLLRCRYRWPAARRICPGSSATTSGNRCHADPATVDKLLSRHGRDRPRRCRRWPPHIRQSCSLPRQNSQQAAAAGMRRGGHQELVRSGTVASTGAIVLFGIDSTIYGAEITGHEAYRQNDRRQPDDRLGTQIGATIMLLPDLPVGGLRALKACIGHNRYPARPPSARLPKRLMRKRLTGNARQQTLFKISDVTQARHPAEVARQNADRVRKYQVGKAVSAIQVWSHCRGTPKSGCMFARDVALFPGRHGRRRRTDVCVTCPALHSAKHRSSATL